MPFTLLRFAPTSSYRALRRQVLRKASPDEAFPVVRSSVSPYEHPTAIEHGRNPAHARMYISTIHPDLLGDRMTEMGYGSAGHRANTAIDLGPHPHGEQWHVSASQGYAPGTPVGTPHTSMTHIPGHSIIHDHDINPFGAAMAFHAEHFLRQHPEYAANQVHHGTTPLPLRMSDLVDSRRLLDKRWPHGVLPLFVHAAPGTEPEDATYHQSGGATDWAALHTARAMNPHDLRSIHQFGPGEKGVVLDGGNGTTEFSRASLVTQTRYAPDAEDPKRWRTYLASVPLHHIMSTLGGGQTHPDEAPDRPRLDMLHGMLRHGYAPVPTPVSPMLLQNVHHNERAAHEYYDRLRSPEAHPIAKRLAPELGAPAHITGHVTALVSRMRGWDRTAWGE